MSLIETVVGNIRKTHLVNGGWERAGRYLTPEASGTLPQGAAGASLTGWQHGGPSRASPGVNAGRAMAAATMQGAQLVETAYFACDAMLAELNAAGTHVTPMQRVGVPLAPLAEAWEVGRNIRLLSPVTGPCMGIVVRGASQGAGSLNDHYFLAAPGSAPGSLPIILHHDQPDAPRDSTLAYAAPGGRSARLSDSLRVSGGVSRQHWCGKYATEPEQWVYINGTGHGGDNKSGWIPVHFAAAESVHSSEVGGPLTWCSRTHELSVTHEGRPLRLGGWYADGVITRGNPRHEAPARWIDEDEPPVTDPQGHAIRVWCMVNMRRKHSFLCGPRDGLREWHTRMPVVETPPCEPTKPQQDGPVTGKYRTYPSLPQTYMLGGPLTPTITFLPAPRGAA